MSTSLTKPAATAAKVAAGTSNNVAEVKGASTPAAHKTAETSSEKAPATESKATVSDTKTTETDTKTTETDAKTANSDAKTGETSTATADVAEKAKELIDSALDAAAGTTANAETEKMVDIKMLRSHPRLAYASGDKGRIPQSLYDELLPDGEFFEKI